MDRLHQYFRDHQMSPSAPAPGLAEGARIVHARRLANLRSADAAGTGMPAVCLCQLSTDSAARHRTGFHPSRLPEAVVPLRITHYDMIEDLDPDGDTSLAELARHH